MVERYYVGVVGYVGLCNWCVSGGSNVEFEGKDDWRWKDWKEERVKKCIMFNNV